jgi:putative ABC transport system permease protein
MKAWLENFAYPVGMDPLIFVISAFACLGIACITVSYQSIRAALRNPADVLKYE